MKSDLRQSLGSIAVLATAGLAIALISIGLLCKVAIYQQGLRLHRMVREQARIIEAMAAHEMGRPADNIRTAGRGDAFEAVLDQVRAAQNKLAGLGQTGELYVAQREGDSIVYLLAHRGLGLKHPARMAFGGANGEPMSRALAGRSGSGILRDYRGVKVLAAYEPVKVFGLGAVAEVELSEVRAPFLKADLIVLAATLAFIVIGGLLLLIVTAPGRRRLRESEERFRQAFEDSAIGRLFTGLDGRLLRVNRAFAEMLGYTVEELQSMDFMAVTHPDDVAVSRETMVRLQSGTEGHARFELRYLHKNGSVVWVDLSAVLLRDATGRPHHFVTDVQDITERKLAEAALRESEERFRLLLHQASDAIYVHELSGDRAGRFLEVNDSVCRMLGYSREEMLAMDVSDIRAPGSLALMPEIISKLRARDRPVFVTENRTKDGRTLPFEVNVSLFDLQGRTVVLAIARDITERKQAEERERQHLEDTVMLRDTALGFIQLAHDADVYQYVADRLSGVVGEAYVIVNSYDETTDQFTVRAAAGIGAQLEAVIKVMGRNPVGTVFTLAREHRSEYASERLLKFEDGIRELSYGRLPGVLAQTIEKTFDVGSIYAMGFHWQGRVLGSVNIIMREGAEVRDPALVESFVNQVAIALQHRLDTDELDRHRVHLEELVAERTRELTAAQEQLVQHEKLATVGRVAGSVAHELRNPLGAIRNASYFLQTTVAQKLEGRPLQHLRTIDVCVERANQAITMILDFTQGRATKAVPCALHSILQQAIAEASLPDSVEVCVAIPPPLPQVLVDSGQVAVVFRNLLTNAARAMPGGGMVKIQARAGQHEVVVDVTDTGTGIKPEHMASLFQPLFTTGEIGIGLGLSICQGFVRANKGTISVVSEPGKGTTFTVTLPAAEGQVTSTKSQ